MNSVFLPTVAIVLGVAVGFLAARWRSRAEISVLERNIDVHLHHFRQQLQMQSDTAERARRAARYEDAYQQLGIWLHDLERAIDEVWSGCVTDDEDVRQRARTLLDRWPWETLRVPAEISFAAFSWSSSVRERIREFEGVSSRFVVRAGAAMDPRNKTGDSQTLETPQSRVWESRSELLAAIDRIRDRVREDLASPGDRRGIQDL